MLKAGKSAPMKNNLSVSTLSVLSLIPRSAAITFVAGALLLALSPAPKVLAVSPAPDGGYPANNTAEGDDALFSLTTGHDNTAIGFDSLYSNTEGFNNTASGAYALGSNTTGLNNSAFGYGARSAITQPARETRRLAVLL